MATGRDRDNKFLTMSEPITLRRFLTRYAEPGGLDPNLIFLIEDIASACRVIGNRLRNAAFEDNHGLAGDTNVQGEDQKKLDVIADEVFARICENSPRLAALVSEERDDAVWIKDPEADDYMNFTILWTGRRISTSTCRSARFFRSAPSGRMVTATCSRPGARSSVQDTRSMDRP
jgi:hypothetical protein